MANSTLLAMTSDREYNKAGIRAKRIFEEMRLAGVKVSPRSFELLLKSLAVSKDPDGVLEALRTMEELNVVPTTQAMNHAIGCLSHKDRLGEAFAQLEKMKRLEIPRALETYNALTEAIMSFRSPEEALAFLEGMMKHDHILPDQSTLVVLLRALGRSGKLQKMLNTLVSLAPIIPPDASVFATVLSAFARQGSLDETEKLYQALSDRNVPVDLRVFNALLFANAKAGSAMGVIRCLRRMKAALVGPCIIASAPPKSKYCFVYGLDR